MSIDNVHELSKMLRMASSLSFESSIDSKHNSKAIFRPGRFRVALITKGMIRFSS